MSDPPALEPGYFLDNLRTTDPEVFEALAGELERQQDGIELIASENLVSQASLEALGSIIVNKTVEGRPGRRYYGGAEFADRIETLAIERAKALFGCKFANVQPHSGSQANQAVFLAVLKPGDTVLSMALDAGGHLSHGAAPNLTGKWFNPVRYGIDAAGFIDMDAVERLAHERRPKLIICGGSAYPRAIDFMRFRKIADSVGRGAARRHGPLRRPRGRRGASEPPPPCPRHDRNHLQEPARRTGRDHPHRRSGARAQARQRRLSRRAGQRDSQRRRGEGGLPGRGAEALVQGLCGPGPDQRESARRGPDGARCHGRIRRHGHAAAGGRPAPARAHRRRGLRQPGGCRPHLQQERGPRRTRSHPP